MTPPRPSSSMIASAAVAVWVLSSCAGTPAPPPLTFAEAGLTPPKAAVKPTVTGSRLERLTARLLSAIERETGQRPALQADDAFHSAVLRSTRQRARGWNYERTALAAEVLRATDTGEATVRSLRRARAALQWDRLAATWIPAVDRALVDTALQRVNDVLPAPSAPELLELVWPVDPVRVTSHFGVRVDPVAGASTRMHTGIDLAALEGQTVRAAGPGTVVFAGQRGGYGLHVDVEHDDGVVTRYAHLSEIEVRVHEPVARGAVLGRAGQSGRVTGPHLHFEVWRDELPVDPRTELPVLLESKLLSRH